MPIRRNPSNVSDVGSPATGSGQLKTGSALVDCRGSLQLQGQHSERTRLLDSPMESPDRPSSPAYLTSCQPPGAFYLVYAEAMRAARSGLGGLSSDSQTAVCVRLLVLAYQPRSVPPYQHGFVLSRASLRTLVSVAFLITPTAILEIAWDGYRRKCAISVNCLQRQRSEYGTVFGTQTEIPPLALRARGTSLGESLLNNVGETCLRLYLAPLTTARRG